MTTEKKTGLNAVMEFVKSRTLARHAYLWRVMQQLQPFKFRVVFANAMLFVATTVSSLALVAMAPFFNEIFGDWDTSQKTMQHLQGKAEWQAEAPPSELPPAEIPETGPAMNKEVGFLMKIPGVQETREWGEARITAFQGWAKTSLERYILTFSGFILILLLIAGFFQFVGELVLVRVGISVMSNILRQIYRNVLHQDMLFFDRSATGTLINTCYREVFQLRPMVRLLASTRPMLPFTMLIYFGMCLAISVQLSLLLLMMLPIVIVPTLLLTQRLKKNLKMELEGEAMPITIMTESFHGIRAIKAFGAEKLEMEYMEPAIQDYIAMTHRRRRAEAIIRPVVDILNMFVMLAIFVLAFLVFNENLNLKAGTLLMFMAAVNRFYKPFRSLMTMNIKMARFDAMAKRVFKLLDRPPEIVEKEEAVPFPKNWKQLELKDIYLSYKVKRRGKKRTRRVLRGVNMIIRRGDLVAVIGPNGAGKSTIMNLICRLYEPNSGIIQFDETNVQDIQLEEIRRHVCLITQQPVLFNRSVAENIAFGMEGLSREDIINAAKATRCHAFIQDLPDDYDTIVGEQGRMLSGGERQKIVLARAFVRQPDLLILDEPTTGLDYGTTQEFLSLVKSLRDRGVTVMYITHDRSHLGHFDRIFALTPEKQVREVTSVEDLEEEEWGTA